MVGYNTHLSFADDGRWLYKISFYLCNGVVVATRIAGMRVSVYADRFQIQISMESTQSGAEIWKPSTKLVDVCDRCTII